MSEPRVTPERARQARLTALLDEARRLEGSARLHFIGRECQGDLALGAELMALLDQAEAAGQRLGGAFPPTVTPARLLGAGAQAPLPTRIAGFRIDAELGRGGMGVVYKGFDERLGRPVAIKAVPPALVACPELRRRLEREARLLAILSHPNIAVLLGIEEEDGRLYLILEYLDGECLADRLKRGPLEMSAALTTCLRIAEGVHSAHRRGVVHRDLKPANVMLTVEGQVKVVDFGLAQSLRRSGNDDRDETRASGAGSFSGTPGYMSPEQATGGEVGPASDLWSLGCILYECLSGERLWDKDSVCERLRAIVVDAPDLGRLPAALPPQVEELLRRCLEKEPKRRPTGMGDVIEALTAATDRSRAATLARRRAERRRGNLSPESDAFVGRARELEELATRLAAGTRLLTVLGPGGSGKTRLVQHHGLASASTWPDGVWFCDLAEARGSDGILHAVATALDVPLGRDPMTQLGDAIAGRGRCLVILDNFEQVAGHAAETVGRWVALASEAAFVVTSRVRLELRGEEVYPLEPLDVEGDGVELFAVRARAQRPGFALTASNRQAVTAVVRLLDSLPLAIELAAARVRVLSVEQIRDRLGDRFRLLTGGKSSSRQASLTATLDWSWDLLTEWEQAALAQASVFEGGFTVEAAEAVLDLAAWPEAPPVLDVLQSLVDRSLLRTTLPDDAGGLRFAMLVSLQAYAAAKLRRENAIARGGSGAGALAAREAQHGAWFARSGRDEAVETLYRHGGVARRRALAHDLDNLVAACRRATARGDGDTAVATLTAAWELLGLRGPVAVAVDLARPLGEGTALGASLRASALLVLAAAYWRTGRLEEARHSGEAGLALARSAGDSLRTTRCARILGQVLGELGRVEEQRLRLEEALAVALQAGFRRGEAHAHNALGTMLRKQGRLDEACRHHEKALAIARESGDRAGEGPELGNLATVRSEQGRSEEALQLWEQALIIIREAGQHQSESILLSALGGVYEDTGRPEEARRHFGNALGVARDIGNRGTQSLVLGNLARVLIDLGRVEEALRHGQEALDIARASGFRRFEAYALVSLGEISLQLGRLEEARRHHEQALVIARANVEPYLQGVVLGNLGEIAARESRFTEGRGQLAEGEALLRAMGSPCELGVLLCQRADLERLAGDLAAAGAALAGAESVAAESGAGPDSRAGTRITRLRAALDLPPRSSG